jgi:D-galactose 1-dehydrogenase
LAKHKIAVIGVGKIAVDQHLPVIEKSDHFELAGTVSTRLVRHAGLPAFRTPAELYAAMPDVGLVAVCTPPGVRHAIVREALDAGKDVLMEKPPTPTISELNDLVEHARKTGRVLFQTWHSQYNRAVEEARRILSSEGVAALRIDWRESVRKWHPGQDWVWEPGGFGVCDPGINALSILARIIPFPLFVERARLQFPSNRQTPVDVEIGFRSNEAHQPAISAGFNWLEEEGEVWTISVVTAKGRRLSIEKGGSVLVVDGETTVAEPPREYEAIYARFAELLRDRQSQVEDAPLRWVADLFMIGERQATAPFDW